MLNPVLYFLISAFLSSDKELALESREELEKIGVNLNLKQKMFFFGAANGFGQMIVRATSIVGRMGERLVRNPLRCFKKILSGIFRNK